MTNFPFSVIRCLAVAFSAIFSLASSGQQVKISVNPGPAAPSALLELESSGKGYLPPRLTTTERDAIASPATGLRIFNLDSGCTNVFNGTTWYELCGDCIPGIPAAPGTIGGGTVQCPLASGQVYSVSPVPGAVSYNWTLPSGWTITSGANTPSITVMVGASTGVSTISVNAQNLCGTGASSTLTVLVGSPAAPGTVSGTAAPCAGTTSLNYSISPVAGATAYNWIVPSGWTITGGAGTAGITVTSGSAGQNGQISVTAQNACGTSSPSSLSVTSQGAPAAPGAITGVSTQCPSLTTQIYSVAAVSGASTYNWTVPGGWTITAGGGTNVITVTTGTNGQNGNISVTSQSACGTSAASTQAVTVITTPAQPGTISGNTSPCPTISGLTYSISAVANASSYAWTVPSGWSITAGNGTTAVTVTSGSAGQTGNISVSASNYCGTGTARTLALSLSTPPSAPTAGTHTPGQTQITWAWNTVSGATGYRYSTSNNYASATSTGGTSFAQTGLTCGTSYTLYVWAENACGGSSTLTLTQSTQTCCSSFTDARDGVTYSAVAIGTACWMAQNLRYLPSVIGPTTGSQTVAYYYVYGYTGTSVTSAKATANYTNHGVLYNWPAAMAGAASSTAVPSGVQGICPSGWHLPSYAEWNNLATALGGASVAGQKMKSTTGWSSNNGTNTSGFNGVPSGNRSPSGGGQFLNMGSAAMYWSATQKFTTASLHKQLNNADNVLWPTDELNPLAKDTGVSVRCVKN